MADPIGGGAAPIASELAINSQDLFEHAATNASALPAGAGPMQLGNEMLNSMQGYVARATSLAERSAGIGGDMPPSFSLVTPGAGVSDPAALSRIPAAQPAVQPSQMDHAIESLGMMFDHAIETQLVVRGTTQLAGAANTLLRGQ